MKKNPHCQGCKYYKPLFYGSEAYACHYAIDTGQLRGCKSEHCDKRDTGKRKKKEDVP